MITKSKPSPKKPQFKSGFAILKMEIFLRESDMDVLEAHAAAINRYASESSFASHWDWKQSIQALLDRGIDEYRRQMERMAAIHQPVIEIAQPENEQLAANPDAVPQRLGATGTAVI